MLPQRRMTPFQSSTSISGIINFCHFKWKRSWLKKISYSTHSLLQLFRECQIICQPFSSFFCVKRYLHTLCLSYSFPIQFELEKNKTRAIILIDSTNSNNNNNNDQLVWLGGMLGAVAVPRVNVYRVRVRGLFPMVGFLSGGNRSFAASAAPLSMISSRLIHCNVFCVCRSQQPDVDQPVDDAAVAWSRRWLDPRRA